MTNMCQDLAVGVSRFSRPWRILLRICMLGWFMAFVTGMTALLPIVWFMWLIPLTLILFWKAMWCFSEALDEKEVKRG